MHFLKILIETPKLEDPAKNYMNVHRHFYRYSKGEFTGPALKISRTKTKITLKGTHEYEDLIQEIITQAATENKIEINGILITGSDISGEIEEFGLDWKLTKSTGQAENYKADISDTIEKNKLLEIIESFRKHSYFLLSYNVNPNCKVTTKKRIPQPSKKKMEDEDMNQKTQFCTGTLNTAEKNIKLIVDSALSDFSSELPDNWKNITLINSYLIDDIILPKDVKNSLLLRIMAIRKGKMIRTIDIDGTIIEKQYNIIA
jgi:hypothetical protein